MKLDNVILNAQSSIKISGSRNLYSDAFQIQNETHDTDSIRRKRETMKNKLMFIMILLSAVLFSGCAKKIQKSENALRACDYIGYSSEYADKLFSEKTDDLDAPLGESVFGEVNFSAETIENIIRMQENESFTMKLVSVSEKYHGFDLKPRRYGDTVLLSSVNDSVYEAIILSNGKTQNIVTVDSKEEKYYYCKDELILLDMHSDLSSSAEETILVELDGKQYIRTMRTEEKKSSNYADDKEKQLQEPEYVYCYFPIESDDKMITLRKGDVTKLTLIEEWSDQSDENYFLVPSDYKYAGYRSYFEQ